MPRSAAESERARASARAAIVATARHLFAERGYFGCRMSDIAREAGMSRGNPYWYFSSKEEVLKEVLAEGFAAVEAPLRSAAERDASGAERLRRLVDSSLVVWREQSEFTAIYLSLLAHGAGGLLRVLGFDTLEIGARYHRYLSAVLGQCRSEGTIADVDPDVLAASFFAFLNGLTITYGRGWAGLPDDAVRDSILRLLGSR